MINIPEERGFMRRGLPLGYKVETFNKCLSVKSIVCEFWDKGLMVGPPSYQHSFKQVYPTPHFLCWQVLHR